MKGKRREVPRREVKEKLYAEVAVTVRVTGSDALIRVEHTLHNCKCSRLCAQTFEFVWLEKIAREFVKSVLLSRCTLFNVLHQQGKNLESTTNKRLIHVTDNGD
jgi:hypothetical protein